MDVGVKLVAAFACSLCFLSACSPKTAGIVFNESAQDTCTGQALSTRYIVQWEDGHFSVEEAANVDEFKEKFLTPNLEQIRKVEYDRVVQFKHAVDDVQTMDTTGTSGTSSSDTWGQDLIQASQVWSQGYYGQNVTVGIVDAFVDVTHQQLAPRMAVNPNEIPNNGKDDDANGCIDDIYGCSYVTGTPTGVSSTAPGTNDSDHGSHVSGIIAADHNTGPIQGLAPQAKLVPAPFIAGDSGGTIGNAILAMQYAAKRGVKIINASWGGAPCMASLQNAISALNQQGIMIVVAAGNDGNDIDEVPDYPAAYNMPNQLTVAAATQDDIMASWSNNGFNLVHLAAPGVNILSTLAPLNGVDNRTGLMSGTSMAAPFVTGTAALLWSARPQATVAQVKTAILRSVDVNPLYEYKVQTYGRLNAKKALDQLIQMLPSP